MRVDGALFAQPDCREHARGDESRSTDAPGDVARRPQPARAPTVVRPTNGRSLTTRLRLRLWGLVRLLWGGRGHRGDFGSRHLDVNAFRDIDADRLLARFSP